MNRFVSGAAAKNLLPIFGEGEAVKGLVDAGPRNQGAAGDFDDGDFMPSITAVQNGGKFSLRMHRDVHGEIAQHDLFADRAEEPLVGQPHRAIGLLDATHRESFSKGWGHYLDNIAKDFSQLRRP